MTEQERKDAATIEAASKCTDCEGNCALYYKNLACRTMLILDLLGVIDRKDKRIEELEERIAIMSDNAGWILIKDKLPPVDTTVIVYAEDKRNPEYKYVTMIDYIRCTTRGKRIDRFESDGYIFRDRVIAWMPLPNPPERLTKEGRREHGL